MYYNVLCVEMRAPTPIQLRLLFCQRDTSEFLSKGISMDKQSDFAPYTQRIQECITMCCVWKWGHQPLSYCSSCFAKGIPVNSFLKELAWISNQILLHIAAFDSLPCLKILLPNSPPTHAHNFLCSSNVVSKAKIGELPKRPTLYSSTLEVWCQVDQSGLDTTQQSQLPRRGRQTKGTSRTVEEYVINKCSSQLKHETCVLGSYGCGHGGRTI